MNQLIYVYYNIVINAKSNNSLVITLLYKVGYPFLNSVLLTTNALVILIIKYTNEHTAYYLYIIT